MFYLDLDEIEGLAKRLLLLSCNKFNLFNLRDKDHLQLSLSNNNGTVKENIIQYLVDNGINEDEIGKIKLLTNLVTAGYIFNPVSFYYVFDHQNKPLCSVVEVCNTFKELKPYFISNEQWDGKFFDKVTTKYFYVSPFIQHDSSFHFQLQIPSSSLNIKIDDLIADEVVLKTGLTGKKTVLNDYTLLYYFFSIPFVTLKVIAAIHWQAMKLWIKKLQYFKKSEHTDLQRDLYRPHNSLKNHANYREPNKVAEPQI